MTTNCRLFLAPIGLGLLVTFFGFVASSAEAPGQPSAGGVEYVNKKLSATGTKVFVGLNADGDDPKQPPKRLIPGPKEDKGPPKVEIVKDTGDEKKDAHKDDDGPPTSKLAFQALAIESRVPGIEITPATINIISTKRFQIVTVKSDGDVKWMVFNKGKEPVEWLQLPGTKSIQVFPTYGADDEITVYAYTAVAGKPTDPVKAVIMVSKKEDKKTPDGPVENPNDKKPTPKVGDKTTLHLTIITDEALAKSNPPLATLIANKDLKAGVEGRGHKLWVMDQKKDIDKIKERGFDDYLRKIAKVPLFIIQDSSGAVVDSGALPTTLVSILQKLDTIVPQKADKEGDGD